MVGLVQSKVGYVAMTHRPGNISGSSAEAPGSTSTTLLERVKARDPKAWQRLVELYAPLVYDWCRANGLQGANAADVGQEVFAAVAAKITGFRHDRPGDSFRGWLWTVTRSKIYDHFRRLQGEVQGRGGTDAQQQLAQIPEDLPASSATHPPTEGLDEVERRALQLVRLAVEERTWQAFWAITVEGRPVADVAEELGMSVPAVYKAKYRVIRQIRRELS